MSDTNTGLLAQAHAELAEAEQAWHAAIATHAQTVQALRLAEQDLPDEISGADYADRQAQRHTLSRRVPKEAQGVQAARLAFQAAQSRVQQYEARLGDLPELIARLDVNGWRYVRVAENIRKCEGQLQTFQAEQAQIRAEQKALQAEQRALAGE